MSALSKHNKEVVRFLAVWFFLVILSVVLFGKDSTVTLFLACPGVILTFGLLGLWFILRDRFFPNAK